jgi:plastocyanin domain-containing protein
MRKIKIGFLGWIGIAFAILIGFQIWWAPKAKEKKLEQQEVMTSREVALLCTTDMATEYHIHPELQIMISGVEYPIPNNLGIQPGCMTSIHTHDEKGVIHVEAPVAKDFTLGDFFAVWQKDFSKEKILDYAADEQHEISVTINGVTVDTYEDTILRDKDKIVISYKTK